jgi:hypothetical protein
LGSKHYRLMTHIFVSNTLLILFIFFKIFHDQKISFLKQILSEDVSCQQISSADFVFVSRIRQKIFFVSRFVFRQQMSLHLSTKRRSRRHIHVHASLFREGNIFSSGGRAFSLQSRLHSGIGTKPLPVTVNRYCRLTTATTTAIFKNRSTTIAFFWRVSYTTTAIRITIPLLLLRYHHYQHS